MGVAGRSWSLVPAGLGPAYFREWAKCLLEAVLLGNEASPEWFSVIS